MARCEAIRAVERSLPLSRSTCRSSQLADTCLLQVCAHLRGAPPLRCPRSRWASLLMGSSPKKVEQASWPAFSRRIRPEARSKRGIHHGGTELRRSRRFANSSGSGKALICSLTLVLGGMMEGRPGTQLCSFPSPAIPWWKFERDSFPGISSNSRHLSLGRRSLGVGCSESLCLRGTIPSHLCGASVLYSSLSPAVYQPGRADLLDSPGPSLMYGF